jgi:hypothetical protein
MVAIGMLAAGLAAAPLRAQIPRIPTTPPAGATIRGGVAPSTSAPLNGSPTLSAPTFDPYAMPNAAASPPTINSGQPFGTAVPSATAPYSSTAPTTSWPTFSNQPSTVFPSTGYPANYQAQPSVLFPNGVGTGWCPDWAQPQEGRYLRLFQDLRLQHTWLMGGDGPEEVGVDQTEVGTTVNFPNFLWSNQPLHVSPVFALDWWDGPDVPRGTFPTDSLAPGPFGLPPRVYAAYVAFAWQPQITPQFSADLETSVGVFTDFQGFTTDSVRIQGTGLGVLALTPTMTLKLGVTYLDRVDLKLLPAGGIVWTPNPQTRWDIYFPRPKLARYLTTIGNTDIWFYLNAEYGGGSWTIGEEAVDRRMDMNDYRAGGGLEWTHQFGVYGFVEAAYVFNRELVFAEDPANPYELDDTVMVRGGIAY